LGRVESAHVTSKTAIQDSPGPAVTESRASFYPLYEINIARVSLFLSSVFHPLLWIQAGLQDSEKGANQELSASRSHRNELGCTLKCSKPKFTWKAPRRKSEKTVICLDLPNLVASARNQISTKMNWMVQPGRQQMQCSPDYIFHQYPAYLTMSEESIASVYDICLPV
jgi:hypothetical protein